MTSQHTEQDFQNATFARHENEWLAVRAREGSYPWHVYKDSGQVLASDLDMSKDKWTPIVECPEQESHMSPRETVDHTEITTDEGAPWDVLTEVVKDVEYEFIGGLNAYPEEIAEELYNRGVRVENRRSIIESLADGYDNWRRDYESTTPRPPM